MFLVHAVAVVSLVVMMLMKLRVQFLDQKLLFGRAGGGFDTNPAAVSPTYQSVWFAKIMLDNTVVANVTPTIIGYYHKLLILNVVHPKLDKTRATMHSLINHPPTDPF